MNNLQAKVQKMRDFNDNFLQLAYEEFTIEFGRHNIIIKNEGAIPVESFLFTLWLIKSDSLPDICSVTNHKGAWEFVLFKDTKAPLSWYIKKAHSFQFVDDPSQLEIIFSERERPPYEPTIF